MSELIYAIQKYSNNPFHNQDGSSFMAIIHREIPDNSTEKHVNIDI
jgi:hypothetical protein